MDCSWIQMLRLCEGFLCCNEGRLEARLHEQRRRHQRVTVNGSKRMRLKLWADEHRELLRALLYWPLLWRVAHRLIIENLSHGESSGATCVVCEALRHKVRYVHIMTYNEKCEYFCKNCGLPCSAWEDNPKCKGNGPKPPAAVPSKPRARIVPIGW